MKLKGLSYQELYDKHKKITNELNKERRNPHKDKDYQYLIEEGLLTTIRQIEDAISGRNKNYEKQIATI